MRISAAERDQTSRRLQAACVAGYLSLDEYSERVGRAMAAQTHADLAVLTADLPLRPGFGQPAAPALRVLLSSVERSGAWRLPEDGSVTVVLGACKLDLRQAALPPLVCLHVTVLLGSLDVIVPAGTDVELQSASVLSNKRLRISGPQPRGAAPRLVLTGLVVAGSLNVYDIPAPHAWSA